MSKKLYDVCAKTGTYTKDGQSKNRYQNVGAVIQGENGPFLILEKWFNPAGLDSDRDSVLLSLFKSDRAQAQPSQAPAGEPFRDDVPF